MRIRLAKTSVTKNSWKTLETVLIKDWMTSNHLMEYKQLKLSREKTVTMKLMHL